MDDDWVSWTALVGREASNQSLTLTRRSFPPQTPSPSRRYNFVAACMLKERDQVSKCKTEWKDFRGCMEKGDVEKKGAGAPK
jgi:hypothetical protein